MEDYNVTRLKERGYLNDNDEKILKHLQAINNIFKKKDTNISNLFAFGSIGESTLTACVRINDSEYCFKSFNDIPCDGGDPNRGDGFLDLRQESELDELLDEMDRKDGWL